MYSNIDDIRKNEKYSYFTELGYTDKEATVLSLINFSGDRRLRGLCEAFAVQKEKRFIDFIADNYFADDCDHVSEEESFDMPITLHQMNRTAFLSRLRPNACDLISKEECCDMPMAMPQKNRASSLSMPSPDDCGARRSDVRETEKTQSSGRPVLSEYKNGPKRNPASVSEMIMRIFEALRTDSYEPIEERTARKTVVSPTATFRPTYNTAAAGILLSNIRAGSGINHSMVRTEELLNYLRYDLKHPEQKKFEITKELKQDGGKTYLFLGVQGEKVLPARQNICLLLDVSGSMSSKTDSVILTIATVLAKMNPGDVFSLVSYSSRDHVIVDGMKLDENKSKDMIFELLAEIEISGYTNGSAGINRAYEIVEKNNIQDGVNRVIIITDGDLNFGIHDKDGLIGLIERKRKTGIYFSAIGTGIFNLQDDKLEVLAKNGNGNYFVVNSLADVRRSIRDDYEALIYPVARNVKAQMEFNPARVGAWKLIGYENRMLNYEDFRNDTIIAEPFGSGSYFIALFELAMNEGENVSPLLKYQITVPIPGNELGTLTVRYEDVPDGKVKETEYIVEYGLSATANIEKAISCARVAEKLRKEDIDELTRKTVQKILSADD